MRHHHALLILGRSEAEYERLVASFREHTRNPSTHQHMSEELSDLWRLADQLNHLRTEVPMRERLPLEQAQLRAIQAANLPAHLVT